MPGPEMDLKRQLFEAGNRLLKPPGSVDELLALLDRVEHCLSFVEQQPPEGMHDALCPSFKALATNELLNHPDNDVRVGVTACLTEISRITAPDVPYKEDTMKMVFRLTISAFEGLSDKSSKSFAKRVSILETVARVRSCVVLLDLECDGLVVEMFHNFYKCIRDFHAVKVITSMESIMTLIIEENEEISTDLLFSVLSVLKRENKDALPVAKRLGEKVVQNCATKLKSCIVKAIKSLRINLLDYDFVVTKVCQISPDHDPLSDGMLSFSLMSGIESAVKEVEEVAQVLALNDQLRSVVVAETDPSLTMSIQRNDNVEVAKDAAHGLLNFSDIPDSNVVVRSTETVQDQVQDGHDALRSDMTMRPMSEKIAKKRGRKPKNSKETESSKMSNPNGNKKSSDLPVSRVDIGIKVLKALPKVSSVELNVPERKSDSSGQPMSPEAEGNNGVTLGSPSLSDNPGNSSPVMNRSSEKPSQEATSSPKNTKDNSSDELNDKDTPCGVVGDASKSVSLVEVKKEQDIEGVSEDNPLKESGIHLRVSDETSRMKKRGRPRRDASISAEIGVRDGVSSEGTSKKRSSHRFILPEDGKEYGEELVGTRIKVWWGQDKVYYEGIVESFDSFKKRHKILYIDNEREVLNLRKEKWKIKKSSVGSEKDGVAWHTTAGDSSDAQQIERLKADSVSDGILGNTGTPAKRRRGRPPKNAAVVANYDSPVNVSKPEDETNANESKVDSTADARNPIKSMDLIAKCGPILDLNVKLENSEHNVFENGGTQANQDSTMGMGVKDSMAPKAAVEFNINETFTVGSSEKPGANETATSKSGNSNVNVTEEVNSGLSAGREIEGIDQNISVSGTGLKLRKRKARTSSYSSSPAVPVSKRCGRPSKLSLGTSDGKSKGLSKQLGDPKVDEPENFGHSDNVVVVNSKDSLVEGRNVPFMNAELKVSEHGAPGNNVTKSSRESMGMATEEDVALPSSTGELKSGSPAGLKLKLKTSGTELNLRKRKSRTNTTLLSEQVNKDGSVKRPRGRPCKPKIEVPDPDSKLEGSSHPRPAGKHKADDSASAAKSKAEIIHKADVPRGNGSGSIFKNCAPKTSNVPKDPVSVDVGTKDEQDFLEIADNVDTPSLKLCFQ